jgi:uncharacterized protein YndB with AHSA1/START domain
MRHTEVIVSRTIRAEPAHVFDLWLDSGSPGSPWFGAERLVLNAVVGGLFYFSVKHEGSSWAHYGRFIRIERPLTIEYTWMSEATRGIESTVAVTFDADIDGTALTLRHTDLPDDDMGRQHDAGWTFVVGAIADCFATK